MPQGVSLLLFLYALPPPPLSGIGPLQAMGCIQAVLQACGSRISEAIYMGTAGTSPVSVEGC